MNTIRAATAPARARRQRGRSLVELLIVMALGLLIIGGVATLYLASNQSTRAATSLAGAENLGQTALTLIGASVRRAGYSEIIGTEYTGFSNNALYAGPVLRACRAARFNNDDPGAGCGAATAGASDALAVWFQADTVLTAGQGATDDCLGAPAVAQAVANGNYIGRAANVPVVANTFFLANGALACRTPAGAQQLLAGVEEFKVYFGFDDAQYANPSRSDLPPTASSLRDADSINALAAPTASTSAWDYVVSVTVCVLVRTQDNGVAAQGGSVSYARCPQNAAQAAGRETVATGTATDGALRRPIVQTFAVRAKTVPSPLS